MVPDPHVQRRVYLTLSIGLDGRVALQASYTQPTVGVCAVLLNGRGMLATDPLSIPLISLLPAPLVNDLGTVTIAEKALVQIAAGPRTIALPLAGVVKGDALLLFPTDPLPAGFMIQTAAVAPAAGTLRATLIAPLLAIGASYSITCRVIRLG